MGSKQDMDFELEGQDWNSHFNILISSNKNYYVLGFLLLLL